MAWWEFGENQPKLCHQPPLLLEQVLLVVTASGSAQKWTSVFWNQGKLSLTPQQQQVFPGAKFLLQPGTPGTLLSSAKFWTKHWENQDTRYKMNLSKFQPGSQRGLRFPLLLLVVVEDGRHVLPVMMSWWSSWEWSTWWSWFWYWQRPWASLCRVWIVVLPEEDEKSGEGHHTWVVLYLCGAGIKTVCIEM